MFPRWSSISSKWEYMLSHSSSLLHVTPSNALRHPITTHFTKLITIHGRIAYFLMCFSFSPHWRSPSSVISLTLDSSNLKKRRTIKILQAVHMPSPFNSDLIYEWKQGFLKSPKAAHLMECTKLSDRELNSCTHAHHRMCTITHDHMGPATSLVWVFELREWLPGSTSKHNIFGGSVPLAR